MGVVIQVSDSHTKERRLTAMNPQRMNKILPLLGLLLVSWTWAEEVAPRISDLRVGQKSLVFSPGGEPTENLSTLLEVEILQGTTWAPVPAARVFTQGEKVRFTFTPTQDAFAYLLCKNSDGTKVMLWPSPEAGMNSMVTASERVTLPQMGRPDAGWKIVPPPGREELLLVLSQLRVPELEQVAEAARQRQPAERALTPEEYSSAEKAIGSIVMKDLVYIPVDAGPAESSAGGYVCNTDPSAPLKVKVDINH
jgi:hypothetical protein